MNNDIVKKFKEMYIDEQLEVISNHGSMIQHLNNPNEEFQLAAVKNNPESIRFIRYPTERVIEEAIDIDSSVIQYIDDPSEDIQVMAVKNNPENINLIDNPCRDAIDAVYDEDSEKSWLD